MWKKNMAKLMGIPKSGSNKQKVQPISKPHQDDAKNDASLLDATKSGASDAPTTVSSNIAATYESWLAEHPSALGSFEWMMKAAKGKKIAVFLDYDGTLSPIVDDPDRAFMSDEMRAAVRELAKYFPTAIISGRSREKVTEFVQLTNVYYAGSHGMDIMAPPRKHRPSDAKYLSLGKEANQALFQPAKKFLPAMQEIYSVLVEKVRSIQGASVEDNRFCVSVHFRQVRDEDYSMLEEKVKSVLANYSEFRLTEGKKVLEIRPSIEWNKGHALEYLLDTLGFSNCDDIIPLYIGDDKTDEDAFKVLRMRGKGYPIIVSSSAKDTKASYSLRDPSEVLTFLLRLARWRKSSSSSRSLSQIWGIGNVN